MNKLIILSGILTATLFLCLAGNTEAQVEVTRGSTHKYSVTPVPGTATYVYHWSVTPGGTSSTFGTSATTNDIVWDGAAGTYTITVYASRPVSDCSGNNQTLSVAVLDMNIVWAVNSSTECPKTDNETGDFIITANYTGVSGTWSFNYCIDGNGVQTVTVPAGNNSKDITISGFINTSNAATAMHTIRITSVTTADHYTVNYTGSEADAASRLYTVTIDPTPGTTSIIQL
jgi:hypothetical protein